MSVIEKRGLGPGSGSDLALLEEESTPHPIPFEEGTEMNPFAATGSQVLARMVPALGLQSFVSPTGHHLGKLASAFLHLRATLCVKIHPHPDGNLVTKTNSDQALQAYFEAL